MNERIILLLVVMFSLGLIQIVSVDAIYQGDLIINGNTVYTIIDQDFQINGSIYVEDNATLYLNNANLEFVQKQNYQHGLNLRNPSGGRPHLQIINSNITSNYIHTNWFRDDFEIQMEASFMNESQTFLRSSDPYPEDDPYFPFVNITNSTIRVLRDQAASDLFVDESEFYILNGHETNMDISSSDIHIFQGYEGMNSTIRDSTVYRMMIFTLSGSGSVSIQNIAPGLLGDWSYYSNAVLIDVDAPNITLLNTQIDNWQFYFGDDIRATLEDSTFYSLSMEPSVEVDGWMTVVNSTVETVELRWLTYGDTNVSVENLDPGYFIDFNTWDTSLISINGSIWEQYTSRFANITLIETQVNGWSAFESGRFGSSLNIKVRNSTLSNLYMTAFDEADTVDISGSSITNVLSIGRGVIPEKNDTISNSKIKEFFIGGYTETEISNSVIGGGLFAKGNSIANVYNCSLDEQRAYDNAAIKIFDSPATVESMYVHDSSITEVYDSVVEELEEFNSLRVLIINWDRSVDEMTQEERDTSGVATLYVFGTSNVSRTFTFETQGDGIPVEGVTVKLFEKGGSLLKEGVSDSNGLVDIKAVWGYATGMGTGDEFTVTAERGLNTGTIDVSLSSDKYQIIDMVIVDSDYDGLIDEEDICPYTFGKIEYQGCPVGDENFVELHIIDRPKTTCGGAGSCKLPLEGGLVKVFDRNEPDFQALYTKNPDGTDYPDIFENYPSVVGTCVTGSDGRCIAGEGTTGDYLVIVKYVDEGTGKVVYTGKPKSENDFVDTDEDGVVDLAFKDFQIIKVIKNDGTTDFKAGSKTVITGSILEVIYPQYTIWESEQELYPFIFTSDSDWSVDVCVYVPEGYVVVEGECTQVFVSGETKTVIFNVVDLQSPPPHVTMEIKTKHNGKNKKLNLDIPGKRIGKDKGKDKHDGVPFVLAGMFGLTTVGLVKKRR